MEYDLPRYTGSSRLFPRYSVGLPMLTPPRRNGTEFLDDPGLDASLMVRSLRDIKRSNAVFGGRAAALAECSPFFQVLPKQATLLDVGTGLGDIPAHLVRGATKHGVTLHTIGAELSTALAPLARHRLSHMICANAMALPFPDRSIDIVIASQVLHHFQGSETTTILQEMNRVARTAVVISDLRRCWIAAGGFWLASFPLGFHAITRHDGVTSVLRGFTVAELSSTIESALGVRPVIHRRAGFRLTTSWKPV